MVCTIHNAHSLPLIPYLFATISDSIPPPGRENRFANPKLAAIIPANPAPVIRGGVIENILEFVFVLVAGFVELRVVPIRHVLTQEENCVGRYGLEKGGDEKRDSPSAKHQRHYELRGAAAEIPPPAGDAVGGADHFGGEHGAHPELGRHESGQREAREEADQQERDRGVRDGEAVNGRCREEGEGGGGESWAEEITRGPHGDPGEDGAGNRGDSGVSDVGGGEIKVVADDGEQRRGGEGGDETGEEGDP
nr:hypothetical protein PanWU01x14_263530 [Ipomoea batatas]